MNDLILFAHAKDYIDLLANGINPITHEPVGDDDVVREERVSKCLSYVSQVMENMQNAFKVDQSASKRPIKFWLTTEQRERFPYAEEGMGLRDFTQKLNALSEGNGNRFVRTTLTNWLIQKGILERVRTSPKRVQRIPTEKGEKLGFLWITNDSNYGPYSFVLCNIEAQKYIIDNLDEIVPRTPPQSNNPAAAQRYMKRWTKEEEQRLTELYLANADDKTIANELNRSPRAVRFHIVKLNLTK